MKTNVFATIAARLLRCPAVPYHESEVRAEIEAICREHDLQFNRDKFGNVLVRLQTALRQRPLVLAAHMDHPGFEIIGPHHSGTWLGRFLGGVPDEYFRSNIPLRLMPGRIPARLKKRTGKEKVFGIHPSQTPETPPQFAVWELPDFILKDGQIHARACDDLIGLAAILACLITLRRSRVRVNVIGVISRAEEVGFHGALTVASSRQLPANSLIVSLETSRELPDAKMGRGVIIRVGDRTSLFNSSATRFLTEIATNLTRRDKKFKFQRALMHGGTCEATAYQEFGYQTSAVCIALGNYHNCAPHKTIAAEYVDIKDACGMVDLLVAAASGIKGFDQIIGKLPVRLNKMLSEARKKLRAKGV